MLVLVYRMRGEWNLLDFLPFRHPFRYGNPVGTRCNMAEQLPLASSLAGAGARLIAFDPPERREWCN
jgi:hypothetical protein